MFELVLIFNYLIFRDMVILALLLIQSLKTRTVHLTKNKIMQKRININSAEPEALKAMMGLETYLSKVDISKSLKELIKIRASQINGCAYCIDMHTRDALKNGETDQRIFLLNAWREAGSIFSDEERSVLSIAEEVTLIHQQGLTDNTYSNALKYFTENQIAQIVIAVVTINAWNRIALSSHLQVGGGFA